MRDIPIVRKRPSTALRDERRDETYIHALQRSFEAELTKGLAEHNALKKHKIAWTVEHGDLVPYDIQTENEDGNLVDLYPAHSENVLFKQKRNRTSKKEVQLIDWSLPGQDHESAKYKNCGQIVYIPTDNLSEYGDEYGNDHTFDRTPIIASCDHDHDHYAKAKKHCCYQLSCPRCWNDAALRRAQAAEAKILSHRYLSIKRERTLEQKIADKKDLSLNHWVLSFRVDSGAVNMARTVRGYNKLREIAKSLLVEAGMKGGAMVFHPWRWSTKNKQWKIGLHFHIIGYGWLNTKQFQQKYSPTINLIKVHEHDEILSVYLTVAYLLTHTGIARIPKRDKDIDWNKRFVAQMKRFWKMKEIREFSEEEMFKTDPNHLMDESYSVNSDHDQSRLGSFYTSESNSDGFVSSFTGEDQKIFTDPSSFSFDLFPDDEELWAEFERKHNLPSISVPKRPESRFMDVPDRKKELCDKDDVDDLCDDSEDFVFGLDPFFESSSSMLDGFNWRQFVLGAYTQKCQTITYFGAISTKNIRIFGVYKEKVHRTCPECNSAMSLYVHDGSGLKHHEDLYYVKNSPLMCRASEYQMILALYLKFKTDLDDDGHTLLDFARFVPQLVSPEDMNIRPWSDDDIAELQRQTRSEVIVRIMKSSGTTDVRIMSKREVRELGYVGNDEVCPTELRIVYLDNCSEH